MKIVLREIPRETYKNKGWISMGDFLGTGVIATYLKKYRSYKKAKNYVQKLKLKSVGEFDKLHKSRKLPEDIPGVWQLGYKKIYKKEGWKGWGDFIGKTYDPMNVDWLKFNEAKKLISKMNFKKRFEYIEYKNRRKKRLPRKPEIVYKKDWKGWKNFLGANYDPYSSRKYNKAKHLQNALSYNQARRYLKKFKFAGWNDYNRRWGKLNLEKKNIPLTAHKFYKNKGWKGWKDFLGTK